MATISERRGTPAGAPADDYDVGAAFDAHAIEWWIYDGARLVPAPPEQAALLTRLHDGAPRAACHRPGRWRGFARRRRWRSPHES
jgi:hypothetical protein